MQAVRKYWGVLLLFIALGVSTSLLVDRMVQRVTGGIVEVLEAATGAPVVTLDFSQQIATGSPLIFGGAHAPPVTEQFAWDMLADVGVTSIRRDFYVEHSVPEKISLQEYLNNTGDVQNVTNWNANFINGTKSIYENAKKRGMKTIGIISYAPPWLTYLGKNNGVPKNWDVYKEIIKKIYRIHRPYLDYVEIWNEPDLKHFLDVTGSSYTVEAAYKDIFYYAGTAVREVDRESGDGRRVPIGGPVLADPRNSKFLEVLLKDTKTRSLLDFISYHAYGDIDIFRNRLTTLLEQYNMVNLPLFITEWNKDGEHDKAIDYNTGIRGLPYAGSRFIEFLNTDIQLSNYFSTTKNDVKHPTISAIRAYGVYKLVDGKPVYFPQLRTFRLMSKTMGLGAGPSKVIASSAGGGLATSGFVNSRGIGGFVVANEGGSQTVTVSAKALNLSDWTFGLSSKATVTVYMASETHDGASVVCSDLVSVSGGAIKFEIDLPALSVLGVTITPGGISMDRFMDILGVSTEKGCVRPSYAKAMAGK